MKLGLKPGHRLVLLSAPDDIDHTLGPLPPDVTVATSLPRTPSVNTVLCFVTARADLAKRLTQARKAMVPDAGLWIAWPKKASKVPTDITENTIRELALPTGLVDNKVCAIDATWSGLRLVIRRKLRDPAKPKDNRKAPRPS